MRRGLLIHVGLMIALGTLSDAGAPSPVQAQAQAPAPAIVAVGHVITISEAPLCGDDHTAMVARLELTRPHRRLGRTVYVVFDCLSAPGLRRAPQVGDVLRLRLVTVPTDFEASITDDFASDGTPRWLAEHATLLRTTP